MPSSRQSTTAASYVANHAAADEAVERHVLYGLALGSGYRTLEWLHELFDEIARSAHGHSVRVTLEKLRTVMRDALVDGLIEAHPLRAGSWRLTPQVEPGVLLELLEHPRYASMQSALMRVDKVQERHTRFWRFPTIDHAATVFRLEFLAGRSPKDVAARWNDACTLFSADDAINHALRCANSVALYERLHPSAKLRAVIARLHRVLLLWEPEPLPLDELALRLLAEPTSEATSLRVLLAQYRWCCGREAEVAELVEPLRKGDEQSAALARAIDGAVLVAQARWTDAQDAFDIALAGLRKASGARKQLLPWLLQWSYIQCLLAQQTPAALERALRYCLDEAGQRKPTSDTICGVVALAAQMRRGDIVRNMRNLDQRFGLPPRVQCWRWLMRAWLKDDATAQALSGDEREAVGALLSALKASGLMRLHEQLTDALNVLLSRPVSPNCFIAGVPEGWEAALAALSAIGGGAHQPKPAEDSRICWVIDLFSGGAIRDILPLEQKRGVRGWNKPQPASLRKLAQSTRLPSHDARVIACLRTPSPRVRDPQLDLAEAVMALIGHPAVEFADAPGVTVALQAAPPRLEVDGKDNQYRLAVNPPLRAAYVRHGTTAADQRVADALAITTVVRDSAQRARVVRYNAEQRRAAVLLGDGLTLPKAAGARLQQVLQNLAAHFEVHADAMAGDADLREVAGASALRAELKPVEHGLQVRLVVAPLGVEGPRCTPGHGRARLYASVQGESLCAMRDLQAEMANVAGVLEACPLLAEGQSDEFEFAVPDAQDALAVLEALSKLECVQSLDWPAGRSITVRSVDLRHLRLQVRAERDWFALSGGVQIDEVRVLQVQELLQWSKSTRGRFVPLGEGRYLALTQELRARIAELAAVVDVRQGEASVPAVAAAWLGEALQGTDCESDEGLENRLVRLAEARTLQPTPPATLRAEFRPYQFDGYQWAMRLAAAGWGACLADDMGLGKTLQALAVMLAREGGGPALVVAPTSLTGNWFSEARKFAPSLRLSVYAEADASGDDRDALLRDAGPGDVVLVSYHLLQVNAGAFAARPWHTLVMDEAQALKNAAAKRTQAVQTLQSDFRLALSGTPIENRLTELWSIMQICNPGLLGTLARFNERFAGPIERDRDRDAQRTLKRLTAPFLLRRTKSQVLDDLPPRTELTLQVQPKAEERAHYEALRRDALMSAQIGLSEGGGKAQFNVLAQLTKLRRAACDPRLVSPDSRLVGAKVQAFAELAEELSANGHKALVFSQFVDFLQLLREPLDAAGIVYQYLDGSTPAIERTRRVASFQSGEGTLFLISLKAGGFGLNLTVADYVVIADPWWNPAAEDQASGRAHRIGQLRPVTVYRLVNVGTLEERIVELHQHKRALAEGVIDGADASALLDAQSLVDLMRG